MRALMATSRQDYTNRVVLPVAFTPFLLDWLSIWFCMYGVHVCLCACVSHFLQSEKVRLKCEGDFESLRAQNGLMSQFCTRARLADIKIAFCVVHRHKTVIEWRKRNDINYLMRLKYGRGRPAEVSIVRSNPNNSGAA